MGPSINARREPSCRPRGWATAVARGVSEKGGAAAVVLQRGEKLHIISRRFFENDVRRHFVGEVEEISETAVRVSGYVFVLDKGRNEFVRHSDKRTRVFPLPDIGLIINVLPRDVEIDNVVYSRVGQHMVCTDGDLFTMNLHEFGPAR